MAEISGLGIWNRETLPAANEAAAGAPLTVFAGRDKGDLARQFDHRNVTCQDARLKLGSSFRHAILRTFPSHFSHF
jgi:hypothetical protein